MNLVVLSSQYIMHLRGIARSLCDCMKYKNEHFIMLAIPLFPVATVQSKKTVYFLLTTPFSRHKKTKITKQDLEKEIYFMPILEK